MTEFTKKSTYNYYLPEELIAQSPATPRDSARLLVYDRKTKKIEHKIFRDIIDYLKPGDVVVLNNSRVIPARIYGVKEQTTLANMYRRKSLPSIQTLTDLCGAFGITLSQFFAEEQNDINNEKTRLLINEFGYLNENQKDFVLEMTNLIKKNLQ